MSQFLAACVQMTSGDVMADNVAQASALVAEAAARGAQLVALPENAFYMRREGLAAGDIPLAQHEGVRWARQAAKEHGIWLLAGSVRALEGEMKIPANRSLLISPEGEIAASYDKLHLFDVTLPDGHSYTESTQVSPGAEPVLACTPFGAIGLSVCYDLRFPGLYRSLALAGAEVLAVPSAFTRPTGEAHWHVLLRARAIENACYVLAPAQCGTHPGGRETYGHSLIIDPWGRILAEASEDIPQIITAEINLEKLRAIRAQLPVLTHHRELTPVIVCGKKPG